MTISKLYQYCSSAAGSHREAKAVRVLVDQSMGVCVGAIVESSSKRSFHTRMVIRLSARPLRAAQCCTKRQLLQQCLCKIVLRAQQQQQHTSEASQAVPGELLAPMRMSRPPSICWESNCSRIHVRGVGARTELLGFWSRRCASVL